MNASPQPLAPHQLVAALAEQRPVRAAATQIAREHRVDGQIEDRFETHARGLPAPWEEPVNERFEHRPGRDIAVQKERI